MKILAFIPQAIRHFWLPVFLFCLPLLLQAQNPQGGRPGGGQQMNIGRFYGRIVDDANGKGIGYASIQLIGPRFDTVSRKMEQVLIAGQLSEENGDFSLENLPVRGEFTLKVSFMGYASVEKKVTFGVSGRPGQNGGGGMENMAAKFDKDLGNIRLVFSEQVLREVTVQGEASGFTLALDKKVYRVDQNGIAAGGTAEDALKNVPSLAVDIDGNVTLRNAAPQIFVDGRPTTLTMDQIPADAIDNVEVISNPSAKYDASGGSAGIVNIVLKKNRKIGYNGSVRAGIDMRGRTNLGGDVNAREGKINAFVGGNLNLRRSLGTGSTDRTNLFGNPTTHILQTTESENNGFFAGGRAGIDWFVSNRNTLTLSGNYNRGRFQPEDQLSIHTDTIYEQYTRASDALRKSESERNFRNLGGQLAFKHLFPKEGKEWTADLNYNGSRSEGNGNFNTQYATFQTQQKQENEGENRFFTTQTDFTSPLNANMKIEAGGRAAIRDYRSENANYQFDEVANTFVRVPGFADRYQYNDQVYAAYTTFSHSFTRWGYQVGLRAESSFYTGDLLDSDSTFSNRYPLSLFPSAFVTYKLNEQDNIQLSYTRRVNRPGFFQLIPFPDFSDSLTVSVGNPGLKPEFTNSLELSYQNIFAQGHNLLVSAYYKYATDLVTRYQYTEFNTILDREAVVSTFRNANSSTAYGVEFTLKNTLWKKLELTTNLNTYNSIVDATNVESSLKNEQFSWFAKENLSLKLPESFTVQISGEYQSRTAFAIDAGGGGGGGRGGMGGGGGYYGGPSSTAQGYSLPNWFVDASIRKDLWKRTASITLSMQDIFRSRRTGQHTESALFVQDSWRRRDPQLVRLNFSYRFGKFDVSLFKRKNTRVSTEGQEGF